MSEVTVATPEGQFTAQAAGPADGPLVLLRHGYPQTRHTWRHQVPALGTAGYRAVAPDQRGYSPGVRPDPAKGGHVGWVTAHRHAGRVRSLAILSRPHPAAFRRAFRENADDQRHRSRHHKIFHDPTTGPRLLEDGARRLRARLAEQGVSEAAIAEYGHPAPALPPGRPRMISSLRSGAASQGCRQRRNPSWRESSRSG